MQTFKSCRRLWELKYKYGVECLQTSEPLKQGLSYHDKVAQLFEQGFFTPDDDAKTNAMATAFWRYIFPELKDKNIQPETWFEKGTAGGNLIVGRYDGVSDDFVIEHKTTSGRVDGSYWAGLELDEQILTYMWASGKRKVFYTAIQRPTIRQSKKETFEEFQNRCVAWYDTDIDQKIGWNIITHTDEEITEFEKQLDRMCEEVKDCNFFYRNQSHCKRFGRMCEYAPICANYDPNIDYVGFRRQDDDRQTAPTESGELSS